MKAKVFFMIMIGFIMTFSSISLKGETTTAHCNATVQIIDPSFNPLSDFYYISIRIETNYPSESAWSPVIGPVTNLNPVNFMSIVFDNVPYPIPVPLDYFTIGVLVSKNGGTPYYYNSSIATPTVLYYGHTQFDPISNPIEVKIP